MGTLRYGLVGEKAHSHARPDLTVSLNDRYCNTAVRSEHTCSSFFVRWRWTVAGVWTELSTRRQQTGIEIKTFGNTTLGTDSDSGVENQQQTLARHHLPTSPPVTHSDMTGYQEMQPPKCVVRSLTCST